MVESLSKSVQSIDAKLDQQSEEIAEIKLALQRLHRLQMNISHPTPTESPVAPQLEKQTPNILTSPLIEQESGRGNLHLHYFLLFLHEGLGSKRRSLNLLRWLIYLIDLVVDNLHYNACGFMKSFFQYFFTTQILVCFLLF